MYNSLRKYQIGLGVLGVFSFGLLLYVIVQAGSVRLDTNTYKAAQKAADALNSYTETHSAPASLADIGIKTTPSTVKYTKLSDTAYKFCVDYRQKSNDFSSADAEASLLTAGYSGTSTYDSYGLPSDSSGTYYLDLGYSHKKGENCQTINVFSQPSYDDNQQSDTSNSSDGSSSNSSSTDPYQACDTQFQKDNNADAYNVCLDKADASSSALTQ